MPLNVAQTRQYIRDFDFTALFIEELGWDYHEQNLPVLADDQTYTLNAVAQKRGVVVFDCACSIPNYSTRQKIERQVAKNVREHLIIYTDRSELTQIWQWVKREIGKPVAYREHRYHCYQPGDSLIQKLQFLEFTLEEEEGLTVVDPTRRVRAAFDVDRVTKRFYDRFKSQHASFLRFIEGIPDEELQRWYASVMLNRLMFIYFIQKKGFLNDDPNYLHTKLEESQLRGRDCFYTDFLCPLFFQGFAQKEDERSEDTKSLLGKVPYLNGGIFLRHQIEELHGEEIHIADAAFEKLFEFFEQYHWHLDERPLRADNEINPDVLGYIFEKYINQKQMGAYYTKEDITEYISKNTVIPYLFDSAYDKCRIAFADPTPDTTVWRLLMDDPDRYIYDAVKRGVELSLPEDIAAGLDDVSKRTEWNKSAPEEYALPTEIWREVAARRKRYIEVKDKLENGDIRNINDLITYNLDIHQFAQDVIQYCEGPELLRAFWQSIKQIKILDPACGSGAFLFAALNILEPLYEACIDRMQVFVDELDSSGEKHHPEKFSDFRKVLDRMLEHPNPRYFILKSIMVNNLYGVDIMEEAIEICKLRMFLKLVAQVEDVEDLEPLPDIDFNVRVGNTLIGYTSLDDVRKTLEGTLGFAKAEVDRIEERAQDLEEFLSLFQEMQTEQGMSPQDFAEAKLEVRQRMEALENELNRYLAGDYGIDANEKTDYDRWLSSYRPFHWFVDFHNIMKEDGFDVIIGNPPYLELRQVDYIPRGFECGDVRAIHAMFIERGLQTLRERGCMSMIVPLALVSTQRMEIVQTLLEKDRNTWYANFSWRPGKLFDYVNRALTIFCITPSEKPRTFSTNYQKWTSDTRELLMSQIRFVKVPYQKSSCWVPKLGFEIEKAILQKFLNCKSILDQFMVSSENLIYYRTTGGLYWKVFTDFPPAFRVNGKPGHSTRETNLTIAEREMLKPAIAVLSSDMFWWWYTITTNCRDLNPYDIKNFPIPASALRDSLLAFLGNEYLDDIERNSIMLVRNQRQTGRTETQSFKIQKSKPVINDIDKALAGHYGFTDEELDFIINYDINYRMGAENDGNDE